MELGNAEECKPTREKKMDTILTALQNAYDHAWKLGQQTREVTDRLLGHELKGDETGEDKPGEPDAALDKLLFWINETEQGLGSIEYNLTRLEQDL